MFIVLFLLLVACLPVFFLFMYWCYICLQLWIESTQIFTIFFYLLRIVSTSTSTQRQGHVCLPAGSILYNPLIYALIYVHIFTVCMFFFFKKSHTCDFCSDTFGYTNSLHRHQKNRHKYQQYPPTSSVFTHHPTQYLQKKTSFKTSQDKYNTRQPVYHQTTCLPVYSPNVTIHHRRYINHSPITISRSNNHTSYKHNGDL